MITLAAPPQYETTCPNCSGATGVPRCVITAGGGTVTVHLCCSGCQHVWSANRATDYSLPELGATVTAKTTHVIH